MNEDRHIQRFRWMVLVSGAVLIILLAAGWIREGLMPDWKAHQRAYHRLALAQQRNQTGNKDEDAGPDPEDRFLRQTGIEQVSPPGLHRTDRCMTCHRGLENPGMQDAPQPHTTHPGAFLADHPVEQFGCTVCHGGQGRAIDRIQAFGEAPSTHWDFPLLRPPYIESSCGKCHLGIFSDHHQLKGTAAFEHGKDIFGREGCLGCHRARGVGGLLGPDLTEQGEKTRHEYSFRNVRGEQTISNWLREHFRDPEMVSPGSEMLRVELEEEELEALVTFTMGLAKPDFSFDYMGLEALAEFRGNREELKPGRLYAMICSACHGKDGEGKDYEQYETGVPAIANRDFLRTAPAEMIRFTLLHGRARRQMASWMPVHSGLHPAELDSLVSSMERAASHVDNTLRNYLSPNALAEHIPNSAPVFPMPVNPPPRGDAGRGREIYESECSTCHGINGMGEIGLPLNNRDFLETASDAFLYRTFVIGRNMAGMPAWPQFSPGDLGDLLAHLRTWGNGPRQDARQPLPPAKVQTGDRAYHYLCSRCHGEFGAGNTGPAILTADFLRIASDAYLYRTISGGRSHTAMFGWSEDVEGADRLGSREISNIIGYMRQTAGEMRDYIYAGPNPGNAGNGGDLFRQHCSECHGVNGEGPLAPALNNQEFLSSATNGYITATITLGREGTRMPSWTKGTEQYPALDARQRRDITAAIRNWQRFRIRQTP